MLATSAPRDTRRARSHQKASRRHRFLRPLARAVTLWGEQLEPRMMLATDLLRADPATDSIFRFNGDTGAPLGAFVSSGSGGLVDPHNPTFGPDGNLYVFSTAPGAQKILKYNGNTGAFVDTFVNTGAGDFAGGTAMAFGPNGDLYVATGGSNVLRFNGTTGAFLGVAASGNGIQRAKGVEFGPDGNLYVLDADDLNNTAYDRILRFNANTAAFIDVFVLPGSLEDSAAFAFGPDGHIYVPDLKLKHTRGFNGTTGAFQNVYTGEGAPIDSFAFDIVWGPDGNAYAATAERVLKFEGETGEFLETFVEGSGGSIAFFPAAGAASDLAVTNLQIPGGVIQGSDASITFTVTNNSASATVIDEWVDVAYLSVDNVFDPTDREIGRIEHTAGLDGGASYSKTLTAPLPASPLGDYRVFVLADRRGVTKDSSRINNFAMSANTLEIFPLAATSHDPAHSIAVGRTLSAYTTADVIGGALTVTYTVYNLTDGYLQGVLLKATLGAEVTFNSASQLPDRNGRELAWNLGTLAPYGRISVEVAVTLASANTQQIDGGASSFGTLDTFAVSDNAPASSLRTGPIDPLLLRATPDANSNDPFIQEKAAELDYDPSRIFAYLTHDVGYESYVGSLRGARGTMWSSAGNALDEASLGVALMRASGIPARYVHGTLSDALSRDLILSMFPDPMTVIGSIPNGTVVSDPANDPQLLAEAREHYWFQFDSGGFQNADTTFDNAAIGQTFNTGSTTNFTEVDEALRHKTTVQVKAEIFNTATSLFGFGGGALTTVLDYVFNDVDLVGRSLSIGNFVQGSTLVARFLAATTHVYSPFILVNEQQGDASQDLVLRGTDYQEFITNFPFGTQVLTGLFLEVSTSEPQLTGAPKVEQFEKTLFDRIGFAGRQAGTTGNVSIAPGSGSALTGQDTFTLFVSPSRQSVKQIPVVGREVKRVATEVSEIPDTGNLDESEIQELARATVPLISGLTTILGDAYLATSDLLTETISVSSLVRIYHASPRLVVVSNRYQASPDASSVASEREIDILRNSTRAYASPGQSRAVEPAVRMLKGTFDSAIESIILRPLAAATGGQTFGAIEVFNAAIQAGINVIHLDADNVSSGLAILPISADAKARISNAVRSGRIVIVPAAPAFVAGQPRTAWLEITPETGEAIYVSETGAHAGVMAEYAATEEGQIAWQQDTEYFLGMRDAQIAGILAEVSINLATIGLEAGLTGPVGAAELRLLIKREILYGIRSAGQAIEVSPIRRSGWLVEFNRIETWMCTHDPALSAQLFSIEASSHHIATAAVFENATRPAGAVSGTVTTTQVQIQGDLEATWSNSSASTMSINSLSASAGTVKDSNGATVGSGNVGIALVDLVATPAVVSGNYTVAVNGDGRLSFYALATTNLGVSGEWDDFTANVTGAITLQVTSAALMLNGVPLPAGTYTITTNAATLTGSGATTSPTFASVASITAANAVVQLPSAAGSATIGGVALNPENGFTLTGYNGTVNVTAGSTADSVVLSGNAIHVLRIADPMSSLTADQNTPVSFPVNVVTSLADTYDLAAEAPEGWVVAIDSTGQATVTPAPGVQAGSFPIRLLARSKTNPALVVHAEVSITATPTLPGVELATSVDDFFYVDVAGGQLPSVFRAEIRNLGPTAETFELSFTNVPAGFEAIAAKNSITVPAGETAIVGFHLNPTGPLPPPGTNASFSVDVASQTNGAVTDSQLVSFTIPQVHGVALAVDPTEVSTTPGLPIQTVLVIESRGNVPETVDLTADASAGLAVAGVQQVTLNPGERKTLSLTFTPAVSTALNSTLSATITATFGGREPVTLAIPVHIAAPGVVSISRAATAMREVGNEDLANRLTDLSIAITNLTLQPLSDVYRTQAIVNLDSVLSLLANDPILARFVGELTVARNELVAAATELEILTALNHVGAALDTFAATAVNLARHGSQLFMVTPPQVAQPGAPATFEALLTNIGTATTTYDLSLGALPAGVTGQVTSPTQVTLAPGAFTTVVATITPPVNEVFPFEFQVNAAVDGLPQLVQSVTGILSARREFVSVVSVIADPPFVDPGGLVSVSTRLLNAVNRQQSALVQFQVFNAANAVVFTSASYPVDLTVQASIETVSLGTVSTGGFPLGQYRIEVTVSDALNVPIPGATGQTALLVGSPVTASLDVGPQSLPPGASTVSNSLVIDVQGLPVGPLSVLSQTDLPGAGGVVKHGHYVYASGTMGIRVYDIADPANPQLIHTFGSSATNLEIRGDKLYALNWSGFMLKIYSLTDPEAPQLLGSVNGIPYSLAWNMVVTDTHVFVSLWSTTQLIGNPQDIKFQTGDVIAIDVSNPTAPVFVSALLNTYGTNNDGIGQFLNADNNGGDGNLWEIVQVNANTLLVAGSTARGDNTQLGSGVIHVVDISNPAHMAIVRTLVIPGTVHAVGLSIEENLAFVTASQGGWNDPAPASNADLTGNLVLAMLDISNPRNPVLIHTEVQARSSVGPYSLHTTSLGNGLFAFTSQGNGVEQSALFVVDASNPTNLLTSQTTIPAINAFGDLEGAGNFLYSTSPSGLIIYEIDPPDSVPVTARVQVPTNTGVSVVPGSFNITPTSILPGVSFDTLVWDLNVSPGTNRTLTWQTMVTALQPGETRAVTLNTTVDFTVLGTPGEVTLPPEQVFAEQILALDPATLTVAPGDSAEYTVRIDNPSSLPVTYDLAVLGVPADWVEIDSEIFVGPNSFALVPLTLTSDDFAALASYGFTVTATVGGVAGSVQGTLVLSGQAVLPEEVPDAHGVVVSIAPQAAIAGQGTPGKYIVRITNPGSVTEAYVLLASGLPAGFSAQFGQVFVELPPGASNYLDVPLSITPPLGTAAGDYPFAVTAAGFNDAAIVDVANATLQVLGLGVALDVLPASVQPNSVFQMLVTNNGAAVDTFDLALGGPAAIAASLDAASVTLASGVSRLVTISLGQIDFAVPGGLTLSAVATSRTNGAVRATDATSVTIDEAFGVSAGFTEHEAVLNAPGTVSFLLEVENVGNLEDSYAAEIVSSTGAVLASLTGLNGLPTASIPQFFLPGLASGAILLNVNLAELGAGSVTVQIRSLTNDTLVAEDTVTVRTVAAPTIDFGDAPNSYGTLGATGAQHTAVGPRLGLLRDSEADGQSSSAALGDDNFGEVDDEDGVTLPGLLVAGSCDCSGTGLGNQIVVIASGVGYLDAWIDFNRNGVFDSSEKIANSIPVAAGANVLNVSVPEGASAGSSYARFRISSTGGLGPAGPASDGEVEDYAIQIFNPTFGSSGIIVDPNNAAASVLYVKGTHYSDAIVVRQTSPGYVTVYVAPFGTTKTYSLSSFQKIVICGLGGADSIAVESPITKPTVLYGDDGPDAISGGSGPDIIFGGASVDALAGNAGDDTLSGGDGSNDSLVGGAGFDRLWESGSGQFTLTSTHFKVGSDSNTISQFEAATLFGGNASDSFNISGWAFPVAIEGGGGTNTIIDSGNGNFTLTTSSLTRVIGGATRVATFTNIHNANLTGGTANNSFNLTAWPLAATLSGAAGTDSFTVTGDVSYTLSDAMLLRPNLGLIRLSGFENATLSAGTSDNTFTVSGWTKAATLSGAGGTDKVISAANVNQTLSTTSLTRTGLGTVTLASIEQAELTGGTGNNTISAATFAGEVKLDGGAGNDTLTGGAGIALLLGGAGNDTLRAGTGRAVMIGGAGLDRLTGGTSDDLLISGQTAHDANAAALALLLAEWASTASYADRVAHLTGTPSGLNGSVRLDGANVLHDTAVDILLGGLGNDLFFAKLINPAQDTLSDKTGGETAL